jgi:beta-N-acetylhexosaminidase
LTSPRAFICGLSGGTLTPAERTFLAAQQPCGVILFKRNCDTPEQVRALTGEIRQVLGAADNYPILIDQEGGRVQRLGPPHWPCYPAGRPFGLAYAKLPGTALAAAHAGARLIAQDLAALGITVNCAPVLDIPVPGAHDVIGDRAYGTHAATVSALAAAVVQGYLDGGVLPVIKHIPGHGRAGRDSHFALPEITASLDELTATDFIPFVVLNRAPMAMTAHVLLNAVDAKTPASSSRVVIEEIVRGLIGFDGLLMCDDLSMGALSGTLGERTRAVLDAGCDVALHCNGGLDEMQAVADATPLLEGAALCRYKAARHSLRPPLPFDEAAAWALLRESLDGHTATA